MNRVPFTMVGSRDPRKKCRELAVDLTQILVDAGYILRTLPIHRLKTLCYASKRVAGIHTYIPTSGSVMARTIASRYYNNWKYIPERYRKSAGATIHAVLGPSLNQPSRFLVTDTTPILQGSSSLALRIAKEYHIPVINLGQFDRVEEVVDQIERIPLLWPELDHRS